MMEAIARLGPRARNAVPRLIQILGDENAFNRKQAAVTLGAIGQEAKAAIPILMEHLEKDEEEFVRAKCADALVRIGAHPRDLVPALIRVCQSHDVDLVESAIQSLGWIGTPAKEATPQLLRLLEDESANLEKDENQRARLRGAAAVALGRIGADREAVVPALTKCLTDHEPGVRVLSAVALSQYGIISSESSTILTDALKSRDWNAIPALNAMEAVGRKHIPLFLAKTRHNDKYERLFGIKALAACPSATDEMLAAISERLKDRESYVRGRAARALGDMGPRAKTQIGALRDAVTNDKDWFVRQAAQAAIDKIDSSGGTNGK
jgi:HEAT repeat protein